jgi:hypothetical protein
MVRSMTDKVWNVLSTSERVAIKRKAISDRRKVKAFDFVRDCLMVIGYFVVVGLACGFGGKP